MVTRFCLGKSWQITLQGSWHKLWPSLMFQEEKDKELNFAGLKEVSSERKLIREFLKHVKSMTDSVN